ncbi:Peptidase M23 [Emticicia oligotrophica DSM 17448]|uniref:Peptidase M23 n=1 Tax=Emticicia oligotrophica (strain DSM 17448 / CIP 109782 / MTCC 6937 / GPTSA100-15) TaxID=929562 RepID=A0ABM5N4I4_EMTOG|nr:peptidoglycan DD-metalloendopeptidase family protein [Emticicia oligotrophica]AFK04353.1 Peptidase M23 [Emticicia oligotrophica DSM 17448]
MSIIKDLEGSYTWLDFTANNQELDDVDLTNTAVFSKYVFNKIAESRAKFGVGGYMEHRVIYRRSEHFSDGRIFGQVQSEPRCIHLGIDIWASAETPIFAPFDGVIHSFQNNDNFGDYGPTIILEHKQVFNFTNHKTLYTLYGHLSLDSLDGLYEGKEIKSGEAFAKIGNYPINGDWPPHLHFQVMTDMLGMKGDFAGVCAMSEQEKYQQICLDPNFILGLK